MDWGPLKPVTVKIPEKLHLTVKGTAPLHRVTLEQAYASALENWLQEQGQSAATPERVYTGALLRILSDTADKSRKPLLTYLKNRLQKDNIPIPALEVHADEKTADEGSSDHGTVQTRRRSAS